MTPGNQAPPPQRGAPARHLSIFDAVCVVVGIVVATGIFRLPQLVALKTSGPTAMLMAWGLGGLLCLIGSLTYADLAAVCPGVGGEYLYLSRSMGRGVGFLFVWARMTVIQTGAIAALAYVFGDYVAPLAGWIGHGASMGLALTAVAVLTLFNVLGLRAGKWMQNALTAAKILGLVAIVAVGLAFGKASPEAPPTAQTSLANTVGSFGLAMVFVLFTYGGWNEAAYVAGELRGRRRSMVWVLVGASVILQVLYLAVNVAYLRVLGFEGIMKTRTVAAHAMGVAVGPGGEVAVSVLVAVAALGAIDGCIFTGARAVYAWGRDYPTFRVLGRWNRRLGSPVTALAAQGGVAMALVALPALSPMLTEKLGGGFQLAVEYTAPVFWAFLFLTALAAIILRAKSPAAPKPLGSWAPLAAAIVLGATCLCILYSSIAYTQMGALVGVAVLLAGVPVYFIARSRREA